jgi:ABC-type Mn2+/Zn2+ transport system permease subunit
VSEFLELFGPALVALFALAATAPAIGAFLQARGAAILGLALPQVALFGTVLGGALGAALGAGAHAHLGTASSYLWAAVATAAALLALGASRRGGASTAARAAALFAAASAGTVLVGDFAPAGALEAGALARGEVLAVGADQLLVALATALLVAAVLATRWRRFAAVGESPAHAAVSGLAVAREELVFGSAVAATCVVGTATLGPLPLFGLLVLPPLAVRGLFWSMASFLVLSVLAGLIGTGLGALLAFEADLPLGASTVAGNALVALVLRRFSV